MRNSICRRRLFRAWRLLARPALAERFKPTTAFPPKRIVATGIFCGFVPENFHPKETGKNYASPLLLKPSILSGRTTRFFGTRSQPKRRTQRDQVFCPVFRRRIKGFAEANVGRPESRPIRRRAYTLPSLALDSGKGSEHTLSWTRNGNPIQAIRSLENLYQMLFRKDDGPRAVKSKGSGGQAFILDLTREQATGFKKGLGKQDREKLDQYFTSVRTGEPDRTIQALARP